MELDLHKYNSAKDKERKFVKVESYNVLIQNPNLLLVKEGKMDVETQPNKSEAPFIEIYKVLFVAACKTIFENAVVVAFYLDPTIGFGLNGYILSGLPDSYSPYDNSIELIDYKSYLEVCDLTSEKKLSFIDYYNEVKNGNAGINSLLTYNDQNLNHDGQRELWRQIDEQEKG